MRGRSFLYEKGDRAAVRAAACAVLARRAGPGRAAGGRVFLFNFYASTYFLKNRRSLNERLKNASNISSIFLCYRFIQAKQKQYT